METVGKDVVQCSKSSRTLSEIKIIPKSEQNFRCVQDLDVSKTLRPDSTMRFASYQVLTTTRAPKPNIEVAVTIF